MIHLFICLCMLITICQEPNDLLTASFILRKLLSFIKHWPAAVHPFTFPSRLHKSLINLSSTLGVLWGTQQYLFANHFAHLAKVSWPLPPPKAHCTLLMQLIASSLQGHFSSVWCFAIALWRRRGSLSSPLCQPASISHKPADLLLLSVWFWTSWLLKAVITVHYTQGS